MEEINNLLTNGGSIILKLIIPAFFGFLVWNVKKMFANQEKFNTETREKLARHERMDISLALAQLNSLHEKCRTKGYVTTEDRDIFIHIYDDYKLSGGNGVAEIVHKQFMGLYEKTSGLSKEELIRLENRNKIEIIEEINRTVGNRLETMCEDMKACLMPSNEEENE